LKYRVQNNVLEVEKLKEVQKSFLKYFIMHFLTAHGKDSMTKATNKQTGG
jgi:hypothetical protein